MNIKKILEDHKKWTKDEGGKRADLTGAYLRGADLTGAYLRGADLRGADLRGADLRGAYLRGADLRGADLTGADLTGADLTGADLTGAYLTDAESTKVEITKPILQIIGMRWIIIIFDKHLKIGCEFHSIEKWEKYTDYEISKMDINALDFWKENKEIIIAFCKMNNRF